MDAHDSSQPEAPVNPPEAAQDPADEQPGHVTPSCSVSRAIWAAQDPADEQPGHSPFPIVGIGASAGGLEAFSHLLAHLPDHTGMAFVLVQHLDPRHESRLTDLLAKATRMPVLEAAHGLAVQPDHVYVIPPNTNMAIAQGVLQVTPRGEARGPHLPVDYLFRSLAQEQRARAIGVVLSGSGSDGTVGLGEIKAIGGITFAQDEKSAKHTGMPRSALDSGCVDFVLPPEEIARRLTEIGAHPYLALAAAAGEEPAEAEDQFQKILAAVRAATEVDFSQYRDTTIRRRIMRRMALRSQQSLADYARLLEEEGSEVEALYRDLLINVTSFFRDPQMFEALKSSVFPEIVKDKSPTAPIRVWVAGCSTGQEAYSLAIALVEFFDDRPVRPPLQIFATDLSDPAALEKARAGVYPESIEAEVTSERLRRFFKKEDHLYRIDKSIRDACVFARQNVTADPPFSHVDLISCRNVLIYMEPPLQKRVLPTFHYALNVPGFLMLGSSETVGEFTDLFELVDREHKVYRKKATAGWPHLHFPAKDYTAITPAGRRTSPPGPSPVDFQKEADRLVLGRYTPPGVLVNENLDILQFRGRTGPYLEPPPGEPTANLLKMAREGLFLELRSALSEAKDRQEAVRREVVHLRDAHGAGLVNLQVLPVKPAGALASCFLVLFEEAGPRALGQAPGKRGEVLGEPPPSWLGRFFGKVFGRSTSPDLSAPRTAPRTAPPLSPGERKDVGEGASASDRESAQLRHELAATKEYLQSLVEQQDAANEELRSANEEVLSSNEELQSTNEELETAKEELQSLNEELTTVNEQLQNRNLELNKLSNDLTNLLTSTTIPVVMVGSDLRIRRLTAPATKVMNLLPTDVGRPIGDIKTNVDVPDLEALIAGVIENVQVREQEVQDRQGHWYALRLYPYRTADHQIDGAVVVLLDIDQIKRAEEEVREARNYARAIVETVREPLLVLDEELRVQTANKSFYETFGVTLEETEGRLVFDLGDRQWDIPALRKLLEEVLPEKKAFQDFEVEHAFPHVGRKTMLLNARVLHRANRPAKILLAIEDVSERKAAELMRIQAEALRRADRRKDQFLATLAHELRNPLSPICNSVQILRLVGDDAAQAGQTRDMLERQVNHLVRIVDDLLNMSRIAEGKMELRKERVVLATIVTTAVENSRSLIEGCGHQLTVTLPPEPVDLEADPDRLEQVLANLLNNAAKFTEAGGQIRLTAELVSGGREPPGDVVIRVADTGIGISAELLPRIFEMFTQGDQSLERTRGGLGVGLALVKSLVQMHGGTVEACSAGPGQGSQFSVRLPLAPKGGQPHASGPQQGRGQRLAGSARRRILVVDDNQDTAKSLGMLLAFMGHEVRIAHDGPGALEAATAFVPEVALLDIGMPGMNGYEVARHIREQPGLGHVFLAALTGYGTDEDRRRSQEAGFDRHLVKPVKLHALEELLAVRERDA